MLYLKGNFRFNKVKDKIYHTIGTVLKSNRTIVEIGNIGTQNDTNI